MRRCLIGLLGLAAVGLAPAAEPQGPPEDWSLHAQTTFVDQWHYGFASPYEGPNSFTNASESKYTLSISFYIDRRLWEGAELVCNPEFFNGYGLSRTLGIAGFPNGEAIKAGFPHLHYNTSRLFLRQSFGFGGGSEAVEDDQNQLSGPVDVDRLVLTVGKFAANDAFDGNAYSHDARSQFMNWALWESGAWDSPGDVLGFTVGGTAEWHARQGSLRYGIMMEPTEANSAYLDHDVGRAFGQILEYDWRYSLGSGKDGTVRPFFYWNRANMGWYPATLALPSPPKVASTRSYRSKEGTGLSWDQALTGDVGAFARLSWNDGKPEDIAFSEIDRSAAAGLSARGSAWGRAGDTLGLATAISGLASSHRTYLERGGIGFLVGDGGLNYGPEEIAEVYYSFSPFSGLWISPDCQYIEHPGYNRDRGGLPVYSVRVHLQY